MKLRLPLQTGAQAIFGAAVASLYVALTIPCLVTGILFPAAFWLLLIGGLAAWLGAWTFRDAWRARPSDIELDAEGLRIIGGTHAGLALPWSKIRSCSIEHADIEGTMLVLLTPTEVRLAATLDADEEASVRAVHHTIEALRDPKPPPAVDPPTEARLLICAGCGGVVSPSDAETVPCPFCQAVIELPAAIREKVSVSLRLSQSRRAIERLASRFVSASSLTRARWAMVPPFAGVAAWVAAFVLGLSWYLHGASSAWGILALDVALGLLAPGLSALFAGALVDRQAAPILAFNLGARPPRKAGEPHACRRCGAPLLEPKDSAVSRCVFCEADNILGISLGHEAAREEHQAGLLEETVSRTRVARQKWRRVGIGVGAGCLAGSLLAIYFVRLTAPLRAEGGATGLDRITWGPFDDAREPQPSLDGSKIHYAIQEHLGKNPALVWGIVPSSGGIGTASGGMSAIFNLGASYQSLLDAFPARAEKAPELPVTREGCATKQGVASEDKAHIAFVADCGGQPRLYVVDVGTGTSRALTSGAAAVQHPQWSGPWIYFDAGGSIFRLRPAAP